MLDSKPSGFEVTAFIQTYNEADILPHTIRHVREEGLRPYVIDNWSTDGTWEMLGKLNVAGCERFPASGPEPYWDMMGAFEHIERLAATMRSDWFTMWDADEIRSSHLAGERLLQAYRRVDQEGYNAIDHQVFCFTPVDNRWDGTQDPETYFRHYSVSNIEYRLSHISAWKNTGNPVNLRTHATHRVLFPNQKVYPERFILKHYPIRSQDHGMRKILQERLPRYRQWEIDRGFNHQYKDVTRDTNFVKDPTILRVWREEDAIRPGAAVVTLTRYPEIFEQFRRSIETHCPKCKKIVVTSGGIKLQAPGWTVIEGPEPFVYSRNANMGILAAGDMDVLLANDDCTWLDPRPLARLRDVAYSEPSIGIVSPHIVGNACNPDQTQVRQLPSRLITCKRAVAFVCVYLKRSVIDAVGFLDHQFRGYGADDIDYGLRVKKAGYKICVAPGVSVRHGFGGQRQSSSFARVMDSEAIKESMRRNRELLIRKHSLKEVQEFAW